ncbi:proton-coupled folate transporter-like [Uloborus diversus]|uniref:proton-coupled folate transporter-like n=1 Tax=Uloborus diversus TaxID=327109 RepID=UPI002408F822|nr:proton-coupled folate transporter-like [Uloborus diversus]
MQKPLSAKIKDGIKQLSIEPYLFLIMFGYNVRLISLQSLFHDRACRVSLNFSQDICNELESDDNTDEQIAAVTYGNNLYNIFVMISTIPALIVASFVGPWSDRYSRKYPLLIATGGVLVDSSLQCIITSFPNASPYWFLVSATISGSCGGLIIMMSGTYSYMSDVTTERSRQVRFAVLEFFTILATPLGSLIGGEVFKVGGYLPVMIIGACSFALGLLWVRFIVLETKPRRFDITKKQMFNDIFKQDNIKESFRTCIKPRAGNLRLQIWLLLFVSFSIKLVHMGSLAIGFPYTRHVFKWQVPRFSYTTASFSSLNAVTTLALVPMLNKRLLVHEAAVGLVGILSLMAKMVIFSVTVYEWLIFYAWISGTLFACGGIAVRSRISKLVSRHELGTYMLL